MVLGYGITRSLDFTDASQGENFLKTEEGGLYLTQLAFAVEIYKDFFVGVDIKYYQGNDKSTEIGEEITQHLNPKYSGIGTSIGFVERLYKSFLIGASVDLPTYIWTSEKYTEWENGSHELLETERRDFFLERPLIFHFGGSYNHKYANIFYELEWTDWRNLEFSSDEFFESDIIDINMEIQNDFKSTTTHHIGAAFHAPWVPVHFYSGYQYMPTPYSGGWDSDKRESLSAGLSIMLNYQFSLHGSFTNYYWKYRGEKESFAQMVFGASVHF